MENMETKNENLQLFKNPEIEPSDENMRTVWSQNSAEKFDMYKKLRELFEAENCEFLWHFYRDGKAWLCKVNDKKMRKTACWLSVWESGLKISIYYPPKKFEAEFVDKNGLFVSYPISYLELADVWGKLVPIFVELRADEASGNLDNLERVVSLAKSRNLK